MDAVEETQHASFNTLADMNRFLARSKIRVVRFAVRPGSGAHWNIYFVPLKNAFEKADPEGWKILERWNRACPGIIQEDPTEKSDAVRSPDHYSRWVIQPKEFIIRNELPAWVSHVVKYVCRAGHKVMQSKGKVQSEIEDITKAMEWCQMRLNFLQGKDKI